MDASRWTLWWFNAMPKQVLGAWILWFNGQVRSGNYCSSSIKVASIEENKNSHQKINMTHTQTTYPNHIALRTVKKRRTSCWGWSPVFEKLATELKIKQKLLKCKLTIQIVTFKVRTLTRIGQLTKLTRR